MDLPRLNAMTAHWAEYPPTYKLLKMIAMTQGIEFKEPSETEAGTEAGKTAPCDKPSNAPSIAEIFSDAPLITSEIDIDVEARAFFEKLKAKPNG